MYKPLQEYVQSFALQLFTLVRWVVSHKDNLSGSFSLLPFWRSAIHCCGRSKWEIQTVSTEIWSFQFFDHCRILSVLTRKCNFGPGHIFLVFVWWIKSDRSFYSGMRLPISKTKKWSNTSCFLQRRKTHREYEIKVGQNLMTETKSDPKTVRQTSKVLAITMEIWERDQTLQCCFHENTLVDSATAKNNISETLRRKNIRRLCDPLTTMASETKETDGFNDRKHW